MLLAESADGVSVKLADFGISILSAELSSGRYGSGTESTSDSSTVAALAASVMEESQSDYLQYQVSDEPSASDVLTVHAAEQAAADDVDGDSATQDVYAPASRLRHSQRTDASSEADVSGSDADAVEAEVDSPLTLDANLTATGVLVGTEQAFLFGRRCMVLRQRRLGIGKRGRQVGSGRERNRAVWCERTATPHRSGSQSDDPFSLRWAPLTHE